MDDDVPDLSAVAMLLGIAAAIGTVFSWSAGTFTFLHAARIIPPALLNRTRLLLGLIVTAVLACAVQMIWPWQLITDSLVSQWTWLGISGFIGYAVGDFFGFSSLRILGARRQSVISTVSPAFAAIGGYFFLNENLSLFSIGGMVLSMLGVMYAMSGAAERDAVHAEGYGSYTQGFLMALAGAACQGIGLVCAKLGLAEAPVATGAPEVAGAFIELGPLHANVMRLSAGFLGTYVFDFIRRDLKSSMKDAFHDKAGTRAMILGTIFGPVIGVGLSLYAVSQLPVAVAQTIFSMVPFVVIATAAVRQHEKISARAIVGAVIAVAGVVILVAT